MDYSYKLLIRMQGGNHHTLQIEVFERGTRSNNQRLALSWPPFHSRRRNDTGVID